MSKEIHVARSPITNRIYAGKVLKDGPPWGAGEADVTGEACAAVAEHVLVRGGTIEVTNHGKRAFWITVERVGEDE